MNAIRLRLIEEGCIKPVKDRPTASYSPAAVAARRHEVLGRKTQKAIAALKRGIRNNR